MLTLAGQQIEVTRGRGMMTQRVGQFSNGASHIWIWPIVVCVIYN